MGNKMLLKTEVKIVLTSIAVATYAYFIDYGLSNDYYSFVEIILFTGMLAAILYNLWKKRWSSVSYIEFEFNVKRTDLIFNF